MGCVRIYLQGRELIPSRIATRKKGPASGLQPEAGPCLTCLSNRDKIFSVTVCTAYVFGGGDVRLTFDQIILLLTLIGASIYATASLTIKVLEYLQKKKD